MTYRSPIGVEDLVLDEFVVVAKAAGIEHLGVVHDDRVVQPTVSNFAIHMLLAQAQRTSKRSLRKFAFAEYTALE